MEGWKQRYALSDQGVKDLRRGIAYSVLANISVMLPVVLLAVVLDGLLKPLTGGGSSRMGVLSYTVTGIVILAVVFLFHYLQYTAAYIGTYEERRETPDSSCGKIKNAAAHIFQSAGSCGPDRNDYGRLCEF